MKDLINKIVTLDNGAKYMILDEVSFEDKKYLMACKMDSDNDMSFKYTYFVVDGNELNTVTDDRIFLEISKIFGQKMD